jgi:dTDP-L-rhamnose 4-epimerase
MRILVTGVDEQVDDVRPDEAGHEVRVLDALLPSAHAVTPDYLNPDAEFVVGDVADADRVRAALRGIDAVCHQAAKVGLGVDIGDAPDYARHNDLGTAVLLAALGATGFNGRVVLAGSMVVYGEGRYRCARHGDVVPGPRRVEDLEAGRFEPRCADCGDQLDPEAVPEQAPVDPRNVYAATKLHQEHLCTAWARESGGSVIALRYHNVYGPRMPRDTPYAGVASIFASSLAADQAPRVFEDGGQLRDFVHVRDVARANLLALEAPAEVSGAFNIGSGVPRSILEMAQALADAHGPDAPRPQVTGEFRLGDVRHVFASVTRAAQTLGFHAREPFAGGMAEFARAPLRAAA